MDLFKRKKKEETGGEDYIDLSDYDSPTEKAAKSFVKIAEIEKYDNLREVTNYVYDGDIIIIDISAVADDEEELKRITQDLKQLTYDINGDVAGLGKELILVTPRDIKIDRTKYKPSEFKSSW